MSSSHSTSAAPARQRLGAALPRLTLCLLLAGLSCSLLGTPELARAALADIAQTPVSNSSAVKPNIMFILDDSGSMASDFMPDEIDNRNLYGFLSSQCNGLAFNPLHTYTPPLRADGTSYPAASFTATPVDGFDASLGTVDLRQRDYIYYTYSGSQAAMGWTYGTNGTVDTTTTFYRECTSAIDDKTSPGYSKFASVMMTDTSPQQQNYANWYAYYRTRQLLMRTAVGRAFQSLSLDFRVGFTVISDTSITGAKFLDVRDFDSTQKTSFYQKLYGAPIAGYTPLRGSLSKIGRYFGKAINGQGYDPMQYSCQRNFALLSTDGYWNAVSNENATYGPLKLDGVTEIGEQDATETRPRRDGTGSSTGGDSNSLADVAEYYWATDLRPDMANNVGATSTDTAKHQHLSTYSLGLGVRGTIAYDRNYLTQTSGDFADIKAGTKNWPIPEGTIASWSTGNATHVDDLWHAALNGRGQYFSALDPAALTEALSATLTDIAKVSRTGAAAAASTLTPVVGDDWVFLPSYTNMPSWQGDLRAFKFTIDSSGNISAPNTAAGQEVWSAAAKLDARTTARKIVFNANGTLADFTAAALTSAGLSTAFEGRCSSAATLLAQCSSLTTAARTKVTAANLVSFLAGDTSLYLNASSADDRVFRTRGSRLGDFVNASPVYVGKPPYKYADAGYASYVSAQASRTKVVYAASNDGMLHAFKVGADASDSTGGTELWAFIPSAVLPELWRLADTDYDSNHRYFVDATPNVADVYDGTRWRSILVGGLGAGGRSYYALDVTDPTSPTLLWEFSHANLGYTLSNPVITKNAAGTWVVAFTSGVNNVSPGDGVGRLYVVNAVTGALVTAVSTASGTTSTPSNLGRLNAWVNKDSNNTAERFYAGDMLGDMWRFDPDDKVPPSGSEAVLLGTARAANGAIQPIHGKPMLSEVKLGTTSTATAIVTWGTGRMLGNSDLLDTTTQSIYSVKDSLAATGLGVLRNTTAGLVQQTLNSARQIGTVQTVDWATQNGWYVDLNIASGERIALDGTPLATGVMAFASSVPSRVASAQGGGAYVYQFDLATGKVLNTPTQLPLLVGLGRIVSNNGKISALLTTQDQQTLLSASLESSTGSTGTIRRSAWRELMD